MKPPGPRALVARLGLLGLLGLLGPPGAVAAPAAAEAPRRTLFIVLDSVAFSTVARISDPALGEEAALRGFHPPVPLISTFPSSTSIALVGILGPAGVGRSPGYEARFFDWERRRVRGGGPVSYFNIEFPWREFFDWTRKGVLRSALAALRPVRASNWRVEKAVEVFLESDEERFFVYVETTDMVAHLLAPEAMEEVVRNLDRTLREARRRHPDRPFRAVLLSDHGIGGGEPLVNVWRGLRGRLAERGFRLVSRLAGPRDVALAPFGLVSSFEVYTAPETRAELAAAIAEVDGVDLCVFPSAAGWEIASARGHAGVERRAEDGAFAYRPGSGDPLGFAAILERLRRRAGEPERLFFPDAWWLEESREAVYPDALYRIAAGFELVENPASLLCSVAPGYMFGLVRTELAARLTQGRLRWTHGALDRDPSLGFITSDDPDWTPPPAVRFSHALLPFLEEAETRP